jgi:hypothetical protein
VNVQSSTIAGNWAGHEGGGVWKRSRGTLVANNSIISLNTADNGSNDVQGPYTGSNNLIANSNPGFVSNPSRYVDGDVHLLQSSVAVDAGSNAALPADTYDIDDDGNVSEALPLDLGGNARVQDGDDNGTPIVDIGAFELATAAPGALNEAADALAALGCSGSSETPVDHVLNASEDWLNT